MTAYLDNFRSFGSNCEFGLVLETASFTEGGFLKNALVQDFSFVIAALDGNFEGMYKPENIVPYHSSMVRDTKYGLCWHTKLQIGWVGDALELIGPEDVRLATMADERSKMYYLVERLLNELATEHKIYVMRSNEDIPIETPRAILMRLRERGQASMIVMKQSNEEHGPATVGVLEDGIYVGYLPHLGLNPNLEDVDHAGWHETCKNAWALHESIHGKVDAA